MNRSEKPSPDRWTVPVAVEDIPDAGGHYELTADAATREAIVKIAGLRTLPRLAAVFDVERRGAGVQVSGQIKAKVGQSCVVTLDPVENDVDETVDLLFLPQADAGEAGPRRKKKGDEPPEPLANGVIDLGAVATEFFILGLDPYPRKADVEFAAPSTDDGAAHPFAALGVLKKRSGPTSGDA